MKTNEIKRHVNRKESYRSMNTPNTLLNPVYHPLLSDKSINDHITTSSPQTLRHIGKDRNMNHLHYVYRILQTK